ncbi:MAG TPA: hypothetical protein VJL59_22345 [Anaerolineales bacterium]|nr:hypothetical protein [Anaerolineales bacterium]
MRSDERLETGLGNPETNFVDKLQVFRYPLHCKNEIGIQLVSSLLKMMGRKKRFFQFLPFLPIGGLGCLKRKSTWGTAFHRNR